MALEIKVQHQYNKDPNKDPLLQGKKCDLAVGSKVLCSIWTFFFLVENYGLDLTLVRFVIDMTCSFFFFLVIFNKFCKLCVMIGHSFRWFYFISFYSYFTKIDINK